MRTPFRSKPNPPARRPFHDRPGYADAVLDSVLPAASLAASLSGTPIHRLFQPPTPDRLCVLLSSVSACHGAAWLLDRRSPAGPSTAAAWRLAKTAAEAALAASTPLRSQEVPK